MRTERTLSVADARYGVVLGEPTGDLWEELPRLRHLVPKTIGVAIAQVVAYETWFGCVEAHILDLKTGEEILFDRVPPHTVRGRVHPQISSSKFSVQLN